MSVVFVCYNYRPPNRNPDVFLQKLETILAGCNQRLIILGDININTLASSTASDSSLCKKYLELIRSYGMKVQNDVITRFNKITLNHSIIDHVVTQISDNHLKAFTSDLATVDGYSDHNLLCILSPGSKKDVEKVHKFSIKRTNKERMIKSLNLKLSSFFSHIPMLIRNVRNC